MTKYNIKRCLYEENNPPSYVHSDGSKEWSKNGKFHREKAPARMWSWGTEEWYLNGIRYSPEKMPIKLFMAYCNWEYKKKNGI